MGTGSYEEYQRYRFTRMGKLGLCCATFGGATFGGAFEALFYDKTCVFPSRVLGYSVHQENGLNNGDVGRIMVASSAGTGSFREYSQSDSTGDWRRRCLSKYTS